MFDLMIGKILCKIGLHQWRRSRTGKTHYCTRKCYAPEKTKYGYMAYCMWVCGKEKKR